MIYLMALSVAQHYTKLNDRVTSKMEWMWLEAILSKF